MKHLLSLLIAALPFTASAQSIKAGDMNNDGQYTIGDLANVIAAANGSRPAEHINIILDNEHVRDYDHELFEGLWDGYDDVYFYNDHADNASGYNTCKFQFPTSFNGLVDKHIEKAINPGVVDFRDINVVRQLVLGKANAYTQVDEYHFVAPESNAENNALLLAETKWLRTIGEGHKQARKYIEFKEDGTITTTESASNTIFPEGALYYVFEPVHGRIRFYNEARELAGTLNVIHLEDHILVVNTPGTNNFYRLDR